ncbi:MAG TPA: RES domain-containing protein [Conexibacter sp.]|jgi:hypothetical protein
MTPQIAAASPDGQIHRIGRAPDAWAWPDWAYAGEDGTFGNRWDDPSGEYRVLYASSQRLGAYLETLARFRPDPALQAAMTEIDDDPDFPTAPAGLVPAGWRERRCIGSAHHSGPFANIGHSDSIAHLRAALAAELVHHGLDDLDAGDLRRRAPRRFTQAISRYVFEHGRDRDGRPYVGIAYASRLGDDLTNWAVFEGSEPHGQTTEPIACNDPDFGRALEVNGLRLRPRLVR